MTTSGVPIPEGLPGWPVPDPPLTDGGVVLRAWQRDDATALAEAWADPEIRRWTAVPADHEPEAAARWIAGEVARRDRHLALDLVVASVGDAQVVRGEVGLSSVDQTRRAALVGYWIAPASRGRGFARRALALFVPWALEALDLQAVLARCHPDNEASIATARAAGFERLGADRVGYEVYVRRRADRPGP